jgi:DNA-binding protein YbaB
MDSRRDTLALDAPTRAAIDSLQPSQRDALQRLLDQAANEQRQQLEQATEEIWAFLPAGLRPRLRKMMFG